MNFSRFFHIRHLFFLVLFFPTYGFSQQYGVGNECIASPLVSTISVLPPGLPAHFRSFTPIGSGKLIISSDENVWLFDGRNLEPITLKGKPIVSTSQDGKIYIASDREIFRLTPLENGLIQKEIILNDSIISPDLFINDIDILQSGQVYFSTFSKLWLISNPPISIDSCSGSIKLYGSGKKLFYHKPNKGVFFVDSSTNAPLLINGSEKFSKTQPINVLNVDGDVIVVVENYPWITKLDNGSIAHFGDIIQQISSQKTKVKKVLFAFDEFYVLTDREGILILDQLGNFKTRINQNSHPSVEHAIDLAVSSTKYFLTLTPSGIHRFSRPELVGRYSNISGFSVAPSNFLIANNTLFISSIDGVSCAKIINGKPNRLCFSKVTNIDDQIFLLHEFNKKVFAIGADGVYRIEEGKGTKLFDINPHEAGDFVFVADINDEPVLVLVNKLGVDFKSLFEPTKLSKKIPLPQSHGVLTNSLLRKNILYVGYSGDTWHGLDLNSEHLTWEIVKKPEDILRVDLGIIQEIEQHEGFNDFILPLSGSVSNVIVVRCSKAQPNYRSLWLGTFDGLHYNPSSFLGIIPPSELPQQAFMSEDSTVWISSSSGINYYSAKRINLEGSKPSVSIFSTSFLDDSTSIYIHQGYIQEEVKRKNTNYKSPIHNLTINLSSLGFSEWSNNPEGILFSTFIEGQDKQWTTWSPNHVREVPVLRQGFYTIKAKTMNVMGMESEEASFSFTIQPRFYETRFALVAIIVLMILGLYMVFRWRAFTHAKVRFMLESLINQRTEELVKEKEKTDNLLARVLPHDTASELKEKGKVDTQRFKMVTVLFSDIEGFTRITDETNPETLIDQLDKFFLYFDSVVDKYKIEKIKTIGDAYMCAGGIPEKNRTNPVEVILAALEMMLFMKNITSNSSSKSKVWELRIGVDTGPVIAGVVGRSKLTYDIWGSTVNTASRMESSGEAGQINISGNTFMLVKDYFICTFRGKMPVKNKGDIQMYFVNGIKPSLSEGMQGLKPNQDFFILLQLIRLGDLEDLILEKLEKGLPKNLYYHNLKHTVDVYTQVELIGRSENVSKEELLLLRTAALFHDAGHLVDYDTHEEMAVKLVREILPEYQYTDKQLEVISQLIMATKMPPAPKNLLEEIICDADLDYLGRPDFLPVSNMLYKELHEHGKIGTLSEWNELQIKFIDKHFYFTKTARRLRNVNKQSQLDKLKMWMENN